MVRAYAMSLVFWMPLSQVVGLQTYLVDRKEHLPVVLSTILLVDAARYLSVAILTPSIFSWVAQWPIDGSHVRRIVVYVLGYIPFSCAFAIIRWSLLPPWMEDTLAFGPSSLHSLVELTYLTFADVMVIYIGILVAAHAYSYFVRARNEEVERLQLRQLLTQSELQTLRAQLHPHFLFNTLQGVSTLIDTNAPAAKGMLHTLASLLRTVLKRGNADLVSFKEELTFVREYLNIEGMRLGTRLEVRWRVAPDTDGYLIPQLILQPLIENAIVHGVANNRDGGWIEVEARVRADRLQVKIANSVAGSSTPGLRVGLDNVRARLRHLYGDDARLEFQIYHDRCRAIAWLELPALESAAGSPGPEESTV